MKALLLSLLLLCLACALPTNFDLRVEPQRAKYTSYDLQPEGICAGYAWAKQMSQIVGNAAGLYQSQKLSLSAQQILDCTETETAICYKATLEDIHSAIKRLSIEGITTERCYPNRPLSYPNAFCKRECHDGSRFPFNYYPQFKQYSNFNEVANLFKTNDQIAVMAVLKVDDAFNYYSPFSPVLTQGGPTALFEYRVAQVLGWKNAREGMKVILRAGPGEQWGYNGVIDLELSAYGHYIEQFYSVQLQLSQNHLRTA